MYFKLGLETAPVLGCLLLLASTCIPGSVISNGIVGSEGVRPYDIMTLFISFVSSRYNPLSFYLGPFTAFKLSSISWRRLAPCTTYLYLRMKLTPGLHIHLARLHWCPPIPSSFGRYEIRIIRFIPLFRLLRILLLNRLDNRKRPSNPLWYTIPSLLHTPRIHHTRIPNFILVYSFPSIQPRFCALGLE